MEQSDKIAETEDFAARGLRYTKDQFEDVMTQTEDYVRSNPTQSVLYAVLAGYILRILPVGRIISGLLSLVFIAIKPAILVYGATKVYQATQRES